MEKQWSQALDQLLAELDRIGLEAARVLGRAGDVLIHVRENPSESTSDDASQLREARRDIERCRILLEGFCRRHQIEVSK